MTSVMRPGVVSISPQQRHDPDERQQKDPRRPRKVNFFVNGDRYFKGKKLFVTPHRYYNFNDLLNELTGKLPSNINLPYGVRQIYEKNGGQRITDIQDLQDGESYILAGFEGFKDIKYGGTDMEVWSMSKPVKNLEFGVDTSQGNYKYRGYSNNAFAPGKYFRTNGSYSNRRWMPGRVGGSTKNFTASDSYGTSKPKVITIFRNGTRVNANNVKILLNKKSVQSFEQLMSDISEAFTAKSPNHRVYKLYTIRGKHVQSISDFFRKDDLFIGVGHEKFSESEVRNIVQELYPNDDHHIRSIMRSWEKYNKVRESKHLEEVQPKTDKRDSGFAEPSDNSYRDSDSNVPDHRNAKDSVQDSNNAFDSPSKDTLQEAKYRRRQQKLRESEEKAKKEEERKKNLIPLEPIKDPFITKEEAKRRRKEESRRLKEQASLRRKDHEKEQEEEERRQELVREEEQIKAEKAARKRMLEAETEKAIQNAHDRESKLKEEIESSYKLAEESIVTDKEQKNDKSDEQQDTDKPPEDVTNEVIEQKQPTPVPDDKGEEQATVKDVKVDAKKTEQKDVAPVEEKAPEKSKEVTKDKENERPKRKSKAKIIRRSKLERQISNDEHVTSKYDMGRVLGDGNFAVVKQSRLKSSGQEFGIKVIDKKKLKGKEHMVENEIAIMKECSHFNIVKLYEEYETKDHIYLVMELVKGGDLFDAITTSIKFIEMDASKMVRDLCNALFYLHSRNIVHRDLKPENLLVHRNKDGTISLKLADFGLAMEVSDLIYTVCGTPTYVAPEILSEIGYSLEVDMWAVGVIMYILLCGFPPFRSPGRSQTELFKLIKAGEFEFVEPYWNGISPYAKNLIGHLLVVDRTKRYSSIDVLCHPWIMYLGDVKNFPDNSTIEKERREKVHEMEKEALVNFQSYQNSKEKRLHDNVKEAAVSSQKAAEKR